MAVDSNEAAYRKAQIEFVTNNHGTTARETLLMLMPSVCSLLLMLTTSCILGKYLNRATRFILEFLIVIVPTILCCTIYSDAKISVCLALLTLSCTNFMLMIIMANPTTIGNSQPSRVGTRHPFITNFRALTNLLTAICILAVDFKVFPRRHAKTEVYGYSLMDTGVGFFVIANALVSPEARDSGDRRTSGFLTTASRNLHDCLRSCIPLLILGSARYFSVEYLNYQKHVTEYGVHWNFFITLAAVKILTSIVTSLITPNRSLLLGISILGMYEYLLSQKTVKKWVFGHSREGFLNANREGIVSTLGYTGLYFIGVVVGRLIHSTYLRASRAQTGRSTYFNFTIFGRTFEAQYSESMILCVKLSLIAAQACIATLFLNGYRRTSRKLANAGYCAWMVTLSTVMLTLLLLIDIIADIFKQVTSKNKNVTQVQNQISSIPEIFEAINYNGLAFFLICNFLTGAVNMTVRTLYVPDIEAVQIITAYMLASTGLFAVLFRFKIQIKL
ncbi:GPI-anchored wall transfer protein 1 [Neodiprion fabricii]|uniref:GPI-anchored wall transfer protein 1 n=1 Tax=Neodiprion fabricii TaxID=2872261 RepID=UPI001ED90C9F|nr:GPI-anchored wall transfer protein 1 [Neodiprion fabricii]XP_046411851.1 GPI-anchored wall transfer protein 1 [Neodiprion fabricii]